MRVGRVPILANQHAGTEGTSSVDYRQVEVSSLRYSIEETAARPLIWNHFVANHLLEQPVVKTRNVTPRAPNEDSGKPPYSVDFALAMAVCECARH